MNSSSIPEARTTPRTSTIATSQFSDASMVVVINNDSLDTLGDVASNFLGVFAIFGCPRTYYPLLFHKKFPSGTLVPAAYFRAAVE